MRSDCFGTDPSLVVADDYFGNLSPLLKARSAFLYCLTSTFLARPPSCSAAFPFKFSVFLHHLSWLLRMNLFVLWEKIIQARMTGSQSVGPSGGRKRSLRQMTATFRRLIDEEEEEVEGNEGEASSPGEGGRTVLDLVAVHPSSSMDWGSSTLKTSHITQMRSDFFIPSS
ncbi:UNVERIFIED_CONTAM: hypothetical protein Sradi_3793800 [Sesamum radiatum]|uniref:Uncharacterized protein n=1 Tax=Sesamum radiatum TaxID=300843 RepID=A0AAW2Q008_SESRA